jgi:TPR repeat protein
VALGHVIAALLLAVSPGLSGVTAMAASFADGQRAYDAGRFEEAYRIWSPLGEAGGAEAQLGLGLLHDVGHGVAADPALALAWYRRAAEAGLTTAQLNLAVMLDSGRAGPRDPAGAALWYAKAAARGHVRAQFNLGQLYAAGDGVPQNPALAEAWYRAAAAGLPAAAARLSVARQAQRVAASSSPLPLATSLAPESGAKLVAREEPTTVELVWTATAAPVPVQYFVEVLALEADGPRELFAGYHDTSAMLLNLKRAPGQYAWRVSSVSADAATYSTGEWSRFSMVAKD